MEAFDRTPTEVALLERAVPGEALVICAGEGVFLDVVARPAEQQLFDTRPPNRRSAIGSGDRHRFSQGMPPTVLAGGIEPDPNGPIPLRTRRRRT